MKNRLSSLPTIAALTVMSFLGFQQCTAQVVIENKDGTLTSSFPRTIRQDTPETILYYARVNALIKELKDLLPSGTPEQILEVCFRGLSIDPDNGEWLYHTAVSYESLKNPRAELATYRQIANKKNPGGFEGEVHVRLKYVECLLRNRLWAEAILNFNQAENDVDYSKYAPKTGQKFDPAFPDYARLGYVVQYLLGVTRPGFTTLSDKTRIGHLETAAKLMPSGIDAHQMLAHLYASASRFADAREQYKAVSKLTSGDDKVEADKQVSLMAFYVDHPFKPTPKTSPVNVISPK